MYTQVEQLIVVHDSVPKRQRYYYSSSSAIFCCFCCYSFLCLCPSHSFLSVARWMLQFIQGMLRGGTVPKLAGCYGIASTLFITTHHTESFVRQRGVLFSVETLSILQYSLVRFFLNPKMLCSQQERIWIVDTYDS